MNTAVREWFILGYNRRGFKEQVSESKVKSGIITLAEESQNHAIPKISPKLQAVLEQIVNDVVAHMDCIGAMVATLEHGLELVVRAYATAFDVNLLEESPAFANFARLGPGAVLPLQEADYADNLAVQAVLGRDGRANSFLVSHDLAGLFSPLISANDARVLQEKAGIEQVIVLPFTLHGEVVGCLFTVFSRDLSDRQINTLQAFGRQAASVIQNQRRLEAMQALERIVLRLQARMTDEDEVLQTIVNSVVEDLGYAGAMVATLESNRALPVRAYAVNVDQTAVASIEHTVGISLLSDQAVVFLDQPQFQENLSVRAVTGLNGRPEKYLISPHLYDLLRPLADRSVAEQAQQLLGIKQVIAVPFFQADAVVGNLFVTTQKAQFSDWEISLLTALGQHAAAGLRNARLYREMSEQRRIAQTFGRMAFSTVASAHSLRNHVGNISGYMQLLQMLPQLSAERRDFIFRELPMVSEEITKIIDILDNLNEPWRSTTTSEAKVNDCLSRALVELFPRTPLFSHQPKIVTESKITVHLNLADDLPAVKTAKDMLSEALRIIIKNATEALAEVNRQPHIWLTTRLAADRSIVVTIRDNGPGIPPENLAYIFEMGWTTKKGSGMGFGLFWTKDFVEGLGGKLTVSSTVGEGTTFVITLPATAVSPAT